MAAVDDIRTDIELSNLASEIVGADVEVVWQPSDLWAGRAVSGPHHYWLELNPSLKRAPFDERFGVVLHELGHLVCGHVTPPDKFRRSQYAKVSRADLRADDTGQASHLRREVEAWEWAIEKATAAGHAGAAQYAAERRNMDIYRYLRAEVDKMLAQLEERLEKVESTTWTRY